MKVISKNIYFIDKKENEKKNGKGKTNINRYVLNREENNYKEDKELYYSILKPDRIIVNEKEKEEYDNKMYNLYHKKVTLCCGNLNFYQREENDEDLSYPEVLTKYIFLTKEECQKDLVKTIVLSKKKYTDDIVFFSFQVINITIPENTVDRSYLLFYERGNIVHNKKQDLKVIVKIKKNDE